MKAFLSLFVGIYSALILYGLAHDMHKRYSTASTIIGLLISAALYSSAIYFTIWGIRLALSH